MNILVLGDIVSGVGCDFLRKKLPSFKKLKSIDAQRVFLALDTYETDEAKREKVFASLKENTEFLKSHGFEVGAWIWTYWIKDENDYTHMKFTTGNTSAAFVCPSDEKFRSFAGTKTALSAAFK